jgi:hypothetical protein
MDALRWGQAFDRLDQQAELRRQQQQQAEFRHMVDVLESQHPFPETRTGRLQDQVNECRVLGGLQPQPRGCNASFETPQTMWEKALRSGVRSLAEKAKQLGEDTQHAHATYDARSAGFRSIETDLAERAAGIAAETQVLESLL